MLSRGDRRLGRLLEAVKEFGGSQGSFRRAFKSLEGSIPPLEHYAFREVMVCEFCRVFLETHPWCHMRSSIRLECLVMQAVPCPFEIRLRFVNV